METQENYFKGKINLKIDVQHIHLPDVCLESLKLTDNQATINV